MTEGRGRIPDDEKEKEVTEDLGPGILVICVGTTESSTVRYHAERNGWLSTFIFKGSEAHDTAKEKTTVNASTIGGRERVPYETEIGKALMEIPI